MGAPRLHEWIAIAVARFEDEDNLVAGRARIKRGANMPRSVSIEVRASDTDREANPFNHVNADSMAKVALGDDITVLANETVAKDTKDLAPLLGQSPDQIVTVLSTSTAPFFRAYEQSGWSVPITGRIDIAAATDALSSQFINSGGLDGATSITVFNPLIETPGAQDSDESDDIERALKTTTMPSLLGGTYAMDDHNHPHTPMQS
jgi:hypothetical protein